MQTWIYQEKQLKNESRVILLQRARESGLNPPLPAKFASPSDVVNADAPGVLDSVAQTVCPLSFPRSWNLNRDLLF